MDQGCIVAEIFVAFSHYLIFIEIQCIVWTKNKFLRISSSKRISTYTRESEFFEKFLGIFWDLLGIFGNRLGILIEKKLKLTRGEMPNLEPVRELISAP